MWGHLLPMTIVVLSHILSISPSAAAPQNFILPRVADILPRDEKSYDEVSSSWEESNDEKNYPLIQPPNLIDAAILLNNGIPDDLIDDGTREGKLQFEGNNNPKANPSFFDLTVRRRPGSGLWNLMRHEPSVDDHPTQGGTEQQDGGLSNFWNHKPIREPPGALDNVPMVTLVHNEKRSPRCLRRCLAQGLLHPSQCHSLC